MADNTDLARSLYEAWNNRDFDYLSDCMAADGSITDVGSGQTFRGPDGARQYNTAWTDAFPDGRITVDNVIAQDDFVTVEYTGQGTTPGLCPPPPAPSRRLDGRSPCTCATSSSSPTARSRRNAATSTPAR